MSHKSPVCAISANLFLHIGWKLRPINNHRIKMQSTFLLLDDNREKENLGKMPAHADCTEGKTHVHITSTLRLISQLSYIWWRWPLIISLHPIIPPQISCFTNPAWISDLIWQAMPPCSLCWLLCPWLADKNSLDAYTQSWKLKQGRIHPLSLIFICL